MGWTHKLFGLCEHKWAEERRDKRCKVRSGSPDAVVALFEISYCRCEKCGEPKVFNLETW